MLRNIVIAPSGFKESLTAEAAADCIAQGVLRVFPNAIVKKVPIVDGGEGTTHTLVSATKGVLRKAVVTGPIGCMIHSYYGILGGIGPQTAVVELAAAAGLSLVPRHMRNPQKTTTFGVGELISRVLEGYYPDRLLIGCGDSGTNDGGMGLAQALGIRFLDGQGRELGFGGAELKRLWHIDMSGRHPLLDTVQIDVACNMHNILTGPQCVSRVYGPQKGATAEEVESMAAAMERYAEIIKRDTGVDVGTIPGGGASGGAGAGLAAFLGAKLHSRFDIIMKYLDLDRQLGSADLVITGEGAIDCQTPRGKVPAELARRADLFGVPIIVLAGTVGDGAEDNYAAGIDAFTSILPAPMDLENALARTRELLADSAEHSMRFIKIGTRFSQPLAH
ncbi:MAG: glycerate kinase [Chloroflexota bacterium]